MQRHFEKLTGTKSMLGTAHLSSSIVVNATLKKLFEPSQHLLLSTGFAVQICAKRLIPFPPTLVEALERHGHLHLTEVCRNQLLSVSATTANRLLRASRQQKPHGVSTTRAGTLLKNQIPIRTFQDWNETQPGFLEADLVAHCGIQV
jgi:hypothetical protein